MYINEIEELIRLGQVKPLTVESLPKAAAEQAKLNQRFADAMKSPYVGGNSLSAGFSGMTAKASPTKPSRARAVALLLNASQDRPSTRRRKQLQAGKTRRK